VRFEGGLKVENTELLLNTAIDLDAAAERLEEAGFSDIASILREAEFECNEKRAEIGDLT
jgi:hypothetical protein